MALPFILVLDDSPAIRETVAILLAGDYQVEALPAQDFVAVSGQGVPRPSLIIAGESDSTRHALNDLYRGAIPILWIADRSEAAPPAAGDVAERISGRFSPHELRRRVQALLGGPREAPAVDRSRARLCPPYLTAEAARVLAEAASNGLPLHLQGEPGTGKRTVARAIHDTRGGGPFLAANGVGFADAVLPAEGPHGGTLYIEGVDQLTNAGQQRLLHHLDPTGRFLTSAGRRLRLVTSSPADLAEHVDRGTFAAELYYRLAVLAVHLPPLRERAADIPALAELVAADLQAWLGLPQVSFTPRALERLSRYLWFGNLAELEAVLARTLSLCRKEQIDADDLLFESRHLPAHSSEIGSSPERTHPNALAPASLDLIVNELAHEFKNPLVTIKAFAQHLRKALADGEDDEKVARLTGDAVEQIDHTLENLLQFTRLHAPVRESFQLRKLVTPLVEEFTRTLDARGAGLDYEPPPSVPVSIDPAQVTYALGNLLRTLLRDLGPKQGRVQIRYQEPAGISIQFPKGFDPLGGHLATMLDEQDPEGPPLPLGAAIAAAVLERNGARILFPSESEPKTVTVFFAVPHNEEAAVTGNGKAQRTHS